MPETHPFDDAIALHWQFESGHRGETSPAYANMVGPFGGITAAQTLNAVLQHPQRQGEPVALTVNFCAAVADGAFHIIARPVRTNRSTQHWIVETIQNGECVIAATVFTALRRDTWHAPEHAKPEVPSPADVPLRGGRPRVEWINRYEMRFIEGAIPAHWDGSGATASLSRLWMRDQPARGLDYPALAAMADVFFPRIWRRRATLVPVGTVSLTVYFHADRDLLVTTGTGYVLGQAQAQAFRKGYFDQTAQLWNEAGDLLATSHQVVYFRE